MHSHSSARIASSSKTITEACKYDYGLQTCSPTYVQYSVRVCFRSVFRSDHGSFKNHGTTNFQNIATPTIILFWLLFDNSECLSNVTNHPDDLTFPSFAMLCVIVAFWFRIWIRFFITCRLSTPEIWRAIWRAIGRRAFLRVFCLGAEFWPQIWPSSQDSYKI